MNNKKIIILWATIRPEQFIHTQRVWIDRASNKSNIEFHIMVNNQDQLDYLNNKDVGKLSISKTDKIGVCYPSYELSSELEANDDDIVIFASDDFIPPVNYDEYLFAKFREKSGLLFVRDGYQLPDSSNMLHPCITIPIMDYKSLVKMNKVIYHPSYCHMFSDCELYLNAKDLGILIDDRLSDETVFEHYHWVSGKRKSDTNDNSYNLKWKDDEINWNKRKLLNVEDRLLV